YRTEHLDLTEGDFGTLVLGEDDVLMEIKVGGAYPIWMAQLLSELEIYQTSFSKYGTAYKLEVAKDIENRSQLFSVPYVEKKKHYGQYIPAEVLEAGI
ncbi:MAG: VTC domain-containing protein, partial [Lachnospiraceae bacterium]|nr:VTC domain-containing protein [Lachnospiraceae bacterium]